AAIIASYAVLPYGALPIVGDLAAWGVAKGADAFGLAFGLAAPFCAAAILYNLALGAINRAMPQLMVAFVGAPAITGGALLLLLLSGPVALTHWQGRLDAALAAPFGPSPATGIETTR
ncbi:MAG: flagellar biosynthetic protein FliR, partial [Pseudomonadota bacterium]